MAPRVKLYIATEEDKQALAELARAEDFFCGFLAYLGLDDAQMLRYSMNCSGRNYEMTSWSNASRFTKPVAQREALRDPSAKVFVRSKAQLRRLKREKEERAAQIQLQRKEVAGLTDAEVESRLEALFKAYSSVTALIEGDGTKMDTVGYQRLLRDSRVLTNGLGILEADDIYREVVGSRGAGNGEGGGSLATPQSGHMDLPQLRAALERVASAKWPARVAKAGAPAVVQKMLRHWVLPFASVNRSRLPRPVDALFTPKTLALLRGLEHGLKASFGFFANLLALDQKDSSWRATVMNASTLDTQEFFLYMLSFRVSPLLLSKTEVLEVFRKVEAETDADESVDEMLFPAFLEVLAECSLALAQRLGDKMTDATPSEIPALKRFLAGCSPALQEEFGGHLFERGRVFERDPETQSPILPSPLQEAHFKAQMASYNERWDRAFKSRKEQYDHFEQQRKSLIRGSLQMRRTATAQLNLRTGLTGTPARRGIQHGRQLSSSVDDLRSLTKVVFYSGSYNMVGSAKSAEFTPSVAAAPTASGAAAVTGASLLAPYRPVTAPLETLASASGPYGSAERRGGSASGAAAGEKDAPPLELPMLVSGRADKQQPRVAVVDYEAPRKVTERRRAQPKRFIEPRRFNHEAQPHPRLLDPAVGAPGVRSFHAEGAKPGQLDSSAFYLASRAWGY